MYALAMLNHAQPDLRAMDTMLRAAAFLRHNYIRLGARPGQLAVWSEPLAKQSKSQLHYADLGATGLGLVALAEVRLVESKAVSLEDLQSLGRFLLFLQKDDGSFVNKYRAESGPVQDWDSLYYPGEAPLGFISLGSPEPILGVGRETGARVCCRFSRTVSLAGDGNLQPLWFPPQPVYPLSYRVYKSTA